MVLSHMGRRLRALSTLALLLLLAGSLYGKRKPSEEPLPFEYYAGTADIEHGCGGRLEVLRDALAFTCPGGTMSLPFAAITLMEYRPDISKRVLRMNIDWKVRPQQWKARENQYLTVVSNENGKIRALVLKVDSTALRPYLAEIELKSGKNVQVYRSYDETD